MGVFNVRYTEKEKENFKRQMLKMLHEGYYVKEIARELIIADTDAHIMKRKLIEEGKISEDEIKRLATERRRKDNEDRNAKILDEILEGLRQGKSQAKIAEHLPITTSRVSQLVQELIRIGKITSSEIQSAKEMRKAKESTIKPEDKGKPIDYESAKRNMLTFLRLGIPTKKMRNILRVDLDTFTKMKEELIKDGLITNEQIKVAIAMREEASQEKVFELAKQGYNYVEIANEIPYSDRAYVSRIANDLKKTGKLTEEEMELARQRRTGEMRQFIVDGLLQGLTCEEISNSEEGKKRGLTRVAVTYYYKKMKDNGTIDQEAIRQARSEQRKNISEENRKSIPFDNQIITLTELGFTSDQIITITGLSRTYLFKRRKELKQRGIMKDIGTSEARETINKRDEKAKKRRQKIKRMIYFIEDFDSQVVQREIEYAKAMLELGMSEDINIKLLTKAILMSTELLTLTNVKFIVTYFTRNKKGKEAIQFIDSCRNIIDNKEGTLIQVLNSAKREIESYMEKTSAKCRNQLGQQGEGVEH